MIRLAVFDWAGTLVDHGSRAPVLTFVETFARAGVEASEAEARVPMGLEKRAHLAAMLNEPPLRARWEAAKGEVTEEAIDRLYEEFAPIAEEMAANAADPIPGAAETLAILRERGVMIGSTTGYARRIMDQVIPKAKAANVSPDLVVTADEVRAPRPAPDGIYANMKHFDVDAPGEVLVLDDSAPGIQAGNRAGALTIGFSLSGNCAGLSAEALAALSPADRAALKAKAETELRAAGARVVLESIADLPRWLENWR